MYDNNTNNDDEEKSKRKKIRRILLIKTDEELKKISKRNINVMINSKTSEEINKSYDLYNILLSEKSKVYYYYIKTEELIFPICHDIKYIHSSRLVSKTKNIAMSIKTVKNICNEEHSPILNFFPKKIDLGLRKFKPPKRKTKNFYILEGFLDEKNNYNSSNGNGNGNQLIKSTKVQKKGLYKLVDKIINIKMNEDIEKVIKKNIIKLRKYCNKLKIPKNELKKQNKIKKQPSPNETELNEKKRMTLTNNKHFFKKSLFGSVDKKNDSKIKKMITNLKSTKILHVEMHEMNLVSHNKKEEIETNKIISTKNVMKHHLTQKEKKNDSPVKKRKLKKMKSMNGNFHKEWIESKIKKKIKFTKHSEKIKNPGEFTTKHAHESHETKCHFLSSKFEDVSKFKINNNITNTPPKESQKSKYNFLFGKKTQKELSYKEKKENIQSFFNNKEKKEKQKILNLKEKKRKIYNKCLHYSKKEQIIDLFNFEHKGDNDKKGFNILFEFNKKISKKSFESPTKSFFNN